MTRKRKPTTATTPPPAAVTAPAESTAVAAPVVALTRDESRPGCPMVATPAGVELIRRLAVDNSNNGIAEALGIARDTLRELRRRQPEVQQAIDAGRAVDERELVSALKRKAVGGDTIALLFLLKARHGWREGTERDPDGPLVAVQINLPAPAPDVATYLRQLDAQEAREPGATDSAAAPDGGGTDPEREEP